MRPGAILLKASCQKCFNAILLRSFSNKAIEHNFVILEIKIFLDLNFSDVFVSCLMLVSFFFTSRPELNLPSSDLQSLLRQGTRWPLFLMMLMGNPNPRAAAIFVWQIKWPNDLVRYLHTFLYLSYSEKNQPEALDAFLHTYDFVAKVGTPWDATRYHTPLRCTWVGIVYTYAATQGLKMRYIHHPSRTHSLSKHIYLSPS